MISHCKTIYWAGQDIGAGDFKIVDTIRNLVHKISVSNSDQLTNLTVISELHKLVPGNLTDNWSYNPIPNPQIMSKTSRNWATLKLSRQLVRSYVDIGLVGDDLSTVKSRQCFPLPYGNDIIPRELIAKTSEDLESGDTGFFNQNIKGYY